MSTATPTPILPVASTGPHQKVYMSLTASTESAVDVYRAVVDLAAKHAPVEVDLAGVAAAAESLVLNFEIDFGVADEVAIPSEAALVAFQFTADFSEALAVHYPSFTTPPDEAHRQFADSFKSRFSATAAAAFTAAV